MWFDLIKKNDGYFLVDNENIIASSLNDDTLNIPKEILKGRIPDRLNIEYKVDMACTCNTWDKIMNCPFSAILENCNKSFSDGSYIKKEIPVNDKNEVIVLDSYYEPITYSVKDKEPKIGNEITVVGKDDFKFEGEYIGNCEILTPFFGKIKFDKWIQ